MTVIATATSMHSSKGGKLNRHAHPLIALLVLLFSTLPATADIKTFEKEYTYKANELDSKASCRTIALEQVKRLLLQELGVYVESAFIDKSSTKEEKAEVRQEITTLSAGVVGTEIVEEKWDGETYWLKARIKADPDDVAKKLEALRNDTQKKQELEDARKKAAELSAELERLRAELASAKNASANVEQAKKYNDAVQKLSATDWFNKGYAAGSAGDYSGAVAAYSKAIELDPKDAVTYHNRCSAYDNLGNYRQAIADCDKAIELDPKYMKAYNNRGYAYANLDNHRQAITDYDKAIELDPKYAIAYNNRGNSYNALGNYRQAIADCDKAIELDPQFAFAYNKRGYAYAKLGNHQKAITDYDKAIELNPKYAIAYNNRGNAYNALGNYRQAIADLDKAIELDPQFAFAYFNRGVAYDLLGNYRQSIADYKQAARLGHAGAKETLRVYGESW